MRCRNLTALIDSKSVAAWRVSVATLHVMTLKLSSLGHF